MIPDIPCVVVDDIPFCPDPERFLEDIMVDAASPFRTDALQLLEEARAVARPKGVYRLSAVERFDEDTVAIDGVAFTSRVLSTNLDGLNRVFPYVATCGLELEAWSQTSDDPLRRYWMDVAKESALREAMAHLGRELGHAYRPGSRASMNPGSLTDWPISEQRNLFSLFGDVYGLVGVTLTESCLMHPIKSVSGIWFETESGWQNCQLCPREKCSNRRAPYDPELLRRELGG